MLKNLVGFYMDFMFPVIFIPLGVFTICVCIKAICRDISEVIREMDKEKICLKKIAIIFL
jgi:uncharacterized membrane protein (DUF373 family)